MTKLQNLLKGLIKENPVLVLVLGTCPTLAISTSVIAGFVTIVELVMEAYTYELYQSLGVYLALIVVNCIILGRAEMYANKHGVVDSAIDGLGMGLGFTLALCAMATIREILGAGTFCGMPIPWFHDNPIGILTMAPGIRLCGMPGLRQGRLLQREGGKR